VGFSPLAVSRKLNDGGGNYHVVTGEKLKCEGALRIPNLCASDGINCVSLLGLPKVENLSF
jgi:hypothetical protein